MRAVAITAFAAFCLFMLGTGATFAGEPNAFFDHVATPMQPVAPEVSGSGVRARQQVEATGKIDVVRDKFNRIEKVTFTTEDGKTYTIKLSGQGRMLSTADGRSVSISGKAKGMGDGAQLVVSRFTLLDQ